LLLPVGLWVEEMLEDMMEEEEEEEVKSLWARRRSSP
jgi:hypothetical protein